MVKQLSFSDVEYQAKRKRTRREVFLEEMDRVVPWSKLESLIEPHYPKSGNRGRQPYALSTMLRIHFLQNWYSLSDPSMEEMLYEVTSMRQFAGLSLSEGSIPDETTILNFRHMLQQEGLAKALFDEVNTHLSDKGLLLKQGSIVDATIIEAPSSTKNAHGERDSEMHQTKKGEQWHFGMKAHIGVDAESGLVHTVVGTPANVNDVTQAHQLLHGKEQEVYADAGYTGVAKREQNSRCQAQWHVAMKPGLRKQIKRKAKAGGTISKLQDRIEHLIASTRAKVEHPFRVIKCQFGMTKVRYRGLAKNTAQLHVLFALSNLWMTRKTLLGMSAE